MDLDMEYAEDNSEDVKELRRALQSANRRLSEAKAKTADLVEAVYRASQEAILLTKPLSAAKPKPDRRKRKAEVALMHLTDWQGGKRTEDYDSTVMQQRVDKYISKAALITDIQRAHHPVREAVILFGGDLVEGVDIFPGQAWQVDSTLFEQMFTVAAKVEHVVRWALTDFEKVHVVFEPGNHGRLGRRNAGIPQGDNADRMVGEIVRTRLENESRLTWEMRDSWFQKVEVGNYRAMLIHGDEIRSFGGQVPAYSLLRKGTAWASGAARWDFKDIWCGHYHQSMLLTMANGGIIRMTGSTESSNEFASEFVAAVSFPSQRLAFVDAEEGRVTSDHIIWLD